MKKSFKEIPNQLKNAVIGFGGTLPGVGKTYVAEHWAKKLSSMGYQVVLTGSTNKACRGRKTIYSIADWTDMTETRKQKKFVRKEGKIFCQKRAFIMIDEAWMLSQEDIEKVRKQFPKCCILLFGDPNQFPPIEDKHLIKVVEEMSPYQQAIMEIRKAVAKGIERKSIYSLDYMFNLTKQYRVKTPDLKRFLDNVKLGWKDQEDALVFMEKHQYTDQVFDFAICRTWEGQNGVYSYANYGIENDKGVFKRVFKGLKEKVRGVYVGQNNIGAVKNGIYDTKGHSYDSEESITDMSVFTDEMNYKLQGAVTCHSVQGSTFREGVKVVIDVDDAMSIIGDNPNDQVLEDFARFIYIAASRVRNEDDIYFKCKDVKKLLSIMGYHVELKNDLGGEETSSEKLCCCDDPIEFLLSKEGIRDRKPAEFKSKGKIQFNLPFLAQLAYNRSYNSITELRILPNYKLSKELGIAEATVKAHRAEINYMLSHIEEYVKLPNIATTGKTIGEIMAEEEKEMSEPVKVINGNFNFLEELGVEDVFQFLQQFKSVDDFKKWLLEVKHIDWRG